MNKFSAENIKKTAELLKDMLAPRASTSTAPKGPSGLPKRPTNYTDTVQNIHNLTEDNIDPRVVDGVTGTGHGAFIS